MPDREKVIKGLETIRYNLRQMNHGLLADFCDDALKLLKEQEAAKIEVKKINHSGRCGRCPNCLMELNEMDYPNYCGFCGKAVKWK